MTQLAPFVFTAFFAASAAFAQDVSGTWKTESSDSGAYLHVRIGPCGYDETKTCGLVTEAFNASRDDLVGRAIISDMNQTASDRWTGGQIWAPDNDRTYKSKMSLRGDALRVEGCVAIFCRDQTWTRID